MHIDHGGPEFPYEQLATLVRERIDSGEWPPGAKIPSIVDLVAETGLSIMTIRRGIKLVADEGLLIVRPGRGTFVAKTSEGR